MDWDRRLSMRATNEPRCLGAAGGGGRPGGADILYGEWESQPDHSRRVRESLTLGTPGHPGLIKISSRSRFLFCSFPLLSFPLPSLTTRPPVERKGGKRPKIHRRAAKIGTRRPIGRLMAPGHQPL